MQTEAQTATVSEADSLAGKYLTFQMANEVYGVAILTVREIIGLMDITSVPRTPEHIRGVINLRGKIIPVLDLRVRFAMDRTEDTDQTCIIVVDVETEDGASQMGVLVDSVSEVLSIEAEQLEPAPSFDTGLDAGFIRAMAKCGSQVTILLNVDAIVTCADLNSVASATLTDEPVEA